MLSVLLISIDTLRADHLGCYGYRRLTSPNLDRLAAQGAVFENAVAPCSYTAPSFASLMTSRWPSWHAAGFSNMPRVGFSPETILLAELFAAKGFLTAAFVSTVVLSRLSLGLDRGFAIYDDETTLAEENRPLFTRRRAEDTLARAAAWLEGAASRPFFLWVHFMDVHGPYQPPPPYEHFFDRDGLPLTPFDRLHLPLIPDPQFTATAPADYVPGIPAYQALAPEPSRQGGQSAWEPRFRSYLDRYDGAVRYVDLACGRLLSLLKKHGLGDKTVVVVHSDHGEAFGEEGVFFFHGLSVTWDQIHVPLIIKAPHLKPGRRLDPVSLCDVTPFLIEALDLEAPPGLMGRSLLALPEPHRLVPAQVLRQLAVVRGGDLFLYGRGWFEAAENSRLFDDPRWRAHWQQRPARRLDLANDPWGVRPLDPGPAGLEVEAWAEEFVAAANARRRPPTPPPAREAAKEDLAERLKALGYMD